MRCPDCSGSLVQGNVPDPLIPGKGNLANLCRKCKKFIVFCPNCTVRVGLIAPVERGPVGGGQEAWICLWCDAVHCEHCYWKHSTTAHPEKYTLEDDTDRRIRMLRELDEREGNTDDIPPPTSERLALALNIPVEKVREAFQLGDEDRAVEKLLEAMEDVGSRESGCEVLTKP